MNKCFLHFLNLAQKELEKNVPVRRHMIPDGWVQKRNMLSGYYKTSRNRYEGVIINGTDYWVIRPPKGITMSSHCGCFQELMKDSFWVHWSRKPKNIGEGILAIEDHLSRVERQHGIS